MIILHRSYMRLDTSSIHYLLLLQVWWLNPTIKSYKLCYILGNLTKCLANLTTTRLRLCYVPYGDKLWRGETLANLANRPWFTKLKLSKLILIINNLLADLFIRQTFFRQMLEKSQFARFPPAKLDFSSIQYSQFEIS